MCDCKNSVAKDFDPGNRGLSQRHVPPVETLRCFISAAKEVTPFHSRACVLKTMRRRSGRKCIEMAKWFEYARGGTESAREGTESAREGTESAREGTESAREGTESAREGIESAREGTESAREGTESARLSTESALVSLR